MKYLPVGLLVKGKKVLVVGAGKVALQKIRVLGRCSPDIRVVAPQVCPEVRRLAKRGKLQLEERPYRKTDVRGAVLVISATNVPEVNRRVLADAHRAGAVVNVVDVPELCDLIFVSILRTKGFVISISTDGRHAAMSKALRLFLQDRVAEFPGTGYGRKKK